MEHARDAGLQHGPDARVAEVGPDARVAELAARQDGIFTRAQAVAAGLGRGAIERRARLGRWDRLAPDVFRIAGTPQTFRQALRTACLAWGDGSAVSHGGAAALLRLEGDWPPLIELTVPRHRRRKAPGTVHRNALEPVDVTSVGGIPCTTVSRTLIDLSATGAPDVEAALDHALRKGLTSIPRLRWRMSQLGRRPGVTLMASMLDERDARAAQLESELERQLLGILRRAGLPDPVPQHPVARGDGRTAHIDFAYPAAMVAIEVKGYAFHSARAAWESDAVREAELALLGWQVIGVTARQLARPVEVADRIGRALSGRALG